MRNLKNIGKLRAILCLGSVSGLAWAGTFATFTDSGTSSSTFTAGTVDLVVGGDTDDAYAFTSIEMGNMKPGDVKYAPLTIANTGTLGFTYSVATSTSNADGKGLAAQLTLGVKKVANEAACDSAGVGYAAVGLETLTASGSLSAAAISSRSLAAGTSEVACFRIELPSASGDTFQAATTTATFTLSATQS